MPVRSLTGSRFRRMFGSGMQEFGLQDGVVAANGRGQYVRNSIQPVPAIRENHNSASRLAGRDDKGLEPGIIFTVKKE